jgi:hypothetical protein
MTDPSRDVILEAAHFLVEIGNSRHARLSGMLSIRSTGCHAGEGGSFSFEVPRAMPTIGLPLRLRPRVPHDEIERGQDSHREYQYRGDRNHGFGHATTLITASARTDADTQCQHGNRAPKATRPMPVIASLIDASIFR